jgi:ATP-dependent DNA helicase RecQ
MVLISFRYIFIEWGDNFRQEYQQLSELRSFFQTPVMALTVTSTKKVKADITTHLHLSDEDTDIVYKSPDRPNIFIQILKRKSSEYEMSLGWLIDHIRLNGIKSKKNIIYCRSIDTVSDIFLTFKDSLGADAYFDKKKQADNILVEMYHKSTHQDSKERILTEFKSGSSQIRCIIAIVALGMGLDIRDVQFLYDGFTLALIKTTDKDMAAVVKNDSKTCIRKFILETLGDENMSMSQTSSCEGCDIQICPCSACKCCSVCASKCKCQERCKFDVHLFFLHEGTSPENEDCLARRLLTYIWGNRCLYWIYYSKF